MAHPNLYLQSDWTKDKTTMCYTLHRVDHDVMKQWSEDVLNALRHWDNEQAPRFLFDLTQPNVSMSYFVLCHRELYNLGVTTDGRDYFLKYLDTYPDIHVKLAVVLSNTMLAALSSRLPTNYDRHNFSARIFFDREQAEQWVKADPETDSVKTHRIGSNTLLRAIHALDFDEKDIYGDREYLQIMVNGSPEDIPIVEGRPIIVGRSSRANLDLSGFGNLAKSVSRRHAQISLSNGRLSIIDLESRNGTFISGRKVEPGVAIFIRKDDVIKVGNVEFTIRF